MQIKALYNLLRQNWLADQTLQVEGWQVEDLREASSEELFARLRRFEISLDEQTFVLHAENNADPEDLIEYLWVQGEESPLFDQAYLVVFELWRRLLPQKQALSIFCDELDHRITRYEKLGDESVEEQVEELRRVIGENVAHGEDPQTLLGVISDYCAHDLEAFLYDYIVALIEQEKEGEAQALIEELYPCMTNQKGFDFLRTLLLSEGDEVEESLEDL